jgi:excisionase family DNA binding protein
MPDQSLYDLLLHIDSKLSILVKDSHGEPHAYLTVKQAAAKAGVSETTIRRAIYARREANRLRADNVATGKKPCWRINLADLDAWMKRKEGGIQLPSLQTYRSKPGPSRHFRF